MQKQKQKSMVPQEIIEQKIYLVRNKKVMLDSDLALMYGVSTKNLNKSVKRNLDRFPLDFMFQLDEKEFDNLRFQFGTSKMGARRYSPYVFTEQGVAMLSGVLNSQRAVAVNVQIIRTFVKLRELVVSNKGLRIKIETLESKYDKRFKVVFDMLKKLLEKDIGEEDKSENIKKEKIGFICKK
jgi:hypothetical protein